MKQAEILSWIAESGHVIYVSHPGATLHYPSKYTVVSNTYTENGKKLRNFFIQEFPIESIGKCNRVGICYNQYGNFS